LDFGVSAWTPPHSRTLRAAPSIRARRDASRAAYHCYSLAWRQAIPHFPEENQIHVIFPKSIKPVRFRARPDLVESSQNWLKRRESGLVRTRLSAAGRSLNVADRHRLSARGARRPGAPRRTSRPTRERKGTFTLCGKKRERPAGFRGATVCYRRDRRFETAVRQGASRHHR
jgi:hypothetical protein